MSTIFNMGLIRDPISCHEYDIFSALRTVLNTEREGGGSEREREGGREEVRGGGETRKKTKGRGKRWQRKDGRKQRDRETGPEGGICHWKKKKNINKPWTDLAETSWWERDEAMAVTVASGIFQFIGNVMPPEIYWPSLEIHFPFFGLISSSSPCFSSPYPSLSPVPSWKIRMSEFL